MFVFLPIAAFIFYTFLFLRRSFFSTSIGDAFIKSAIVWGTCVVVYVETFSVFHQISPLTAALFWGVVLMTGVVVKFLIPADQQKNLSWKNIQFSKSEWFVIGCIACVWLITCVIAYVAPPNTWDSMTYHLARVMHWIQNKSVELYPTAIPRQLVYSPFPEFSILHLQLLLQSDRLANFVQWFSMIGSCIGVSLITKELGGSRFVRLVAMLVAATIPMGILQSTSTQTDYVNTFWAVSSIFLILRLIKEWRWRDVIFLACVVGLGGLTKGVFYILIVPALLVGLGIALKKYGPKVLAGLLLIMFMIGVINGGYMVRNYQYERAGGNLKIINDVRTKKINAPLLFSNVLRNSFLHAAAPMDQWNELVRSNIEKLHAMIGLTDNEKDITFGSYRFNVWFSSDEDQAPNPLHWGLIVLTLFAMGMFFKRVGLKGWIYVVTLIVSFILFCALVKWQPWISRFHVPWFVLWAPIIAIACDKVGRKPLAIIMVVILLVGSFPWLLRGATRRVISSKKSIFVLKRDQLYFMKKMHLYQVVDKVTAFLGQKGCQQLGLSIGGDSWEYPWWAFMAKQDLAYRIEHVGKEYLMDYPLGDFEPCAIIKEEQASDSRILDINQKRYIKAAQAQGISLYISPQLMVSGPK